ncbi:nitrite reductase large subunit NirB [Alkalimonas sp. NCh-2]|uniref:nitrite reductase large subunit NirB n=1 Tax=Alkalimonas sp. NCh-2 TaxID=3144846 RepID=UPI0031F688E7
MTKPSKQLMVVGNGMVGQHFLEQWLSQQVGSDDWHVTVFAAENRPAYDRVHLSEYFQLMQKTPSTEQPPLQLASNDFYQQPQLSLKLNEPVLAIDRQQQQLRTAHGSYHYDALVLATGSYPFVPPIEGREQPHCLVYRTLDDLEAIYQSSQGASSGVVIGGGLLGLEAANALKQLGLQAHVVEFAPQLMPVQLDAAGGSMLRQQIEALGVQVHTDKATQRIVKSTQRTGEGKEHRLQLEFNDGSSLATDLVVFSAGIRPQDALAKAAGLELGERGGIVIDSSCRTSDPAIYAIGECALWQGQLFGLVAPGYQMARTAAAVLAGDSSASFQGADMSTKLKLLGVDVGSIGDAHGRTPGAVSLYYRNDKAGHYRKLVLDQDGKQLLGAVLVGDNSYYDALLSFALHGMTLPAEPESLILPQGQTSLTPTSLPDSATICSCHNVSKAAICQAVDQGVTELAGIKSCTKAATGCGGCASLLKNVLEQELTSRGVSVSKDLCEHFGYSRQELYHLVRVGKIRTFDQLLQQHGKGHGCEICKPAVASILASCWNEPILAKPHVSLQDTNDTFLANMQKNGTYSVVPRIPGGEITPDMLLVLGEVGRKYQLYTKITGGQRIDLFGATLDQLPLIWQELIDAGFETGHAYGKSLRTVKSCVGSSWCRYGVQDSVSMAILLENRYKGVRAPHKIKMAVSGCTRECAEAQSKDVGVIATENGWNLYVCGNGGMKPRHADLFATDLTDDQLIRTIDRLLMFYIQTADRLQRTSVWLGTLDGGLDYLKAVILDDSLQLGEQLDAQMAHLIAEYQCEWKTALNDPEQRSRFRSFVNAAPPERASFGFQPERGQLIPSRTLEAPQQEIKP